MLGLQVEGSVLVLIITLSILLMMQRCLVAATLLYVLLSSRRHSVDGNEKCYVWLTRLSHSVLGTLPT
jgi:hypothetical protein